MIYLLLLSRCPLCTDLLVFVMISSFLYIFINVTLTRLITLVLTSMVKLAQKKRKMKRTSWKAKRINRVIFCNKIINLLYSLVSPFYSLSYKRVTGSLSYLLPYNPLISSRSSRNLYTASNRISNGPRCKLYK